VFLLRLPPEQAEPPKLLRVERVLAPRGCKLPAIQQRPDERVDKVRIAPRKVCNLGAVDAMKELVEKNGWGPRSGKKR
jgi:hypothetical protein